MLWVFLGGFFVHSSPLPALDPPKPKPQIDRAAEVSFVLVCCFLPILRVGFWVIWSFGIGLRELFLVGYLVGARMDTGAKIFVAGHRGLVGAAIIRALNKQGYKNLVLRTHKELDLTRQADVEDFFHSEKPEYVILAAAKVGGIHANSTYPAEFIAVNLQIQTNVIDAAYRAGVRKLLFLGSSCIYPKHAQVPIVEDSLLTGPLEPTNEWYAVAKIAGIKMCQVCVFITPSFSDDGVAGAHCS